MKKITILLFVALLVACHSDKPTAPFTILKVVKTSGITKIDVQIHARLSKQQLVDISAKIKRDSDQYTNLQLDYLLPGNNYKNLGGVSVYATAAYHPKQKITALDTVKDYNDNFLSFEFIGIPPVKAKYLLSLNPADMKGKTILGKFIDDNLKTVSILYQDSKEENQIYILELDTAGKIVSATAPLEVTHNGIQKLIITQHGDYCTLKDSTLTMYSSDDPDKAYRTLREGI